jgi:hypothetical protein
MEKEHIEMPRNKMAALRTFFNDYDSKKYYASNSPEIKEILPTIKTIVAKAESEKNSREENALAVASDNSFYIKDGWLPTTMKNTIPSLATDVNFSLAVVKRFGRFGGFGLKTFDKAIDTLPSIQKELAKHDIKEFVLTYKDISILRKVKDEMNTILNVTETLSGDSTNRKDLVDALDKLHEIFMNHGIIAKESSINNASE